MIINHSVRAQPRDAWLETENKLFLQPSHSLNTYKASYRITSNSEKKELI